MPYPPVFGGDQGLPALNIKQVSSFPYFQSVSDDVLIFTGSGSCNLILSSAANKLIKIVSKTGTVDFLPAGGESVSQPNVTAGNAAELAPDSGIGWIAS